MGATPAPARGGPAADALVELRTILVGAEARRLDSVEAELRALAATRLSRADLKSATARVLADALREAEISDHRALADAIAPMVVRAIQAEIRNSRDAMVEALYPIVGRLVSASVADGLRRITESIAERIDAMISTRRWNWRFKALVTGRSVGEIALAEARRARATRVLCLERGSGRLIAVWPEAEKDSRSDMVSGLIAAITEFAATTLAQEGGSLRALDLGAHQVLLRSSATLIVAAECDGVLRPQDESAIDEAFLDLLAKHERARDIVSADLAHLDAALAANAPAPRPGGAARWIVRAAAAAAAAWLAWSIGLGALHWSRVHRVEQALAAARAEDPAAAAYPLRLAVDHQAGRVTLIGLAPYESERDRLLAALRVAAEPYALAESVEIVSPRRTVAARLDALSAKVADSDASAAQALAAARAAQEDAARALAADLEQTRSALAAARAEQEAAARALADDLAQAKAALAAARGQSDATRALLAQVQQQLAALTAAAESPQARLREALRTSAVFFIRGSADFADGRAAGSLASSLAGLMKETGARLRVVGHTDETGSDAANQRLSRARAEAVVQLLTKRGVGSDQLLIVSKRSSLPATDDGGAAANRRVTFELAPENEPIR